MDPNFIQQRMNEIQNDESFMDTFSKLVSGGKSGYRTVIEKKKVVLKCTNCPKILEGSERFCPECGTKVEKNS